MKRQGPTWISGLPPILPIVNTTFGIGYEKRVVTGPPCVGLHCVPFGTDGCKNRSYSTLPRLEVFSGGPISKKIMPVVRPTSGLIPTGTMLCKNISGSSAFPRSNGVLGPSSDGLARGGALLHESYRRRIHVVLLVQFRYCFDFTFLCDISSRLSFYIGSQLIAQFDNFPCLCD